MRTKSDLELAVSIGPPSDVVKTFADHLQNALAANNHVQGVQDPKKDEEKKEERQDHVPPLGGVPEVGDGDSRNTVDDPKKDEKKEEKQPGVPAE